MLLTFQGFHRVRRRPAMSALGQKQTFRQDRAMSALPPKADIDRRIWVQASYPPLDHLTDVTAKHGGEGTTIAPAPRKPGTTWHGFVSDDYPIYRSGWNFLTLRNLAPPLEQKRLV